MARKLNYCPITVLLLVLPICVASQDCRDCYQDLRQAVNEKILVTNQLYIIEELADSLQIVIDSLLDNPLNVVEEPTRTSTDGERSAYYQSQIDQLNITVSNLRSQIRLLRNENLQLRELNQQMSNRIRSLKTTVQSLEERIQLLEKELTLAKEEIKILQSRLACIGEFYLSRDSLKRSARIQLDSANARYVQLRQDKSSLPKSEYRKRIEEVWVIYNSYSIDSSTVQCGQYKITDYADLKKGEEHFYTAEILANNEGNMIDLLGDNFNEKMNKTNQVILSELGQALLEGDENTRSKAKQLIKRIPNIIIPERKGEIEGQESNVLYDLKKVPTAYKAGDYAQVLDIFDHYYRFFDLENFENYKKDIGLAKLYAGAILLWNLMNMNDYHSLSFQESWLDNTLNNISTQRDKGRELLQEIVDDDELPYDLKKKAYFFMRKKYSKK